MSDLFHPEPFEESGPSEGRATDGRFVRGNPGGPGRPPRSGVRAATARLDEIGAEASAELIKVAIDLAREGNLEAMRIVLARVWPMRRGRPLAIDVPDVKALPDFVPATVAVTQAVMQGDLTPDEGGKVSSFFRMQCDAIEAVDFERRLTELEKHDEKAARERKERRGFDPVSSVFSGFGDGESE